MNIASIIVQGGLAHRAGQDYDEEQAGRAHTNRVRAHSAKKMDEEEARMPASREIDALKSEILKSELAYQKSTQGRDQGMRDRTASITSSNLDHQARTLPARQGLDAGALTLAAEQQKGAIALQPGQNTIAEVGQGEQLQSLREQQLARIWSLAKLGDAEGAVKLMNTSRLIAPGREFSGVEAGSVPALGNDGKPLMGADGKPVMEKVVRFKAADDKGDMFVPANALDALATKHSTKVEKVGNNLVRLGADGKATPLYEPDQYRLNTETGVPFSQRTGLPRAADGVVAPGAAPGGTPGSRRAENHVDDRVKMAIDKVILPTFGGRFEGGMFFPDEKNKDVALRATQIAGELIRGGMHPEAAGVQAVERAKREKAMADATRPGGGGAPGAYTGPTPWR